MMAVLFLALAFALHGVVFDFCAGRMDLGSSNALVLRSDFHGLDGSGSPY